MTSKVVSKIYGFVFWALVILSAIFFMRVRYSESELTFLTKTVHEVTRGYKINQILATMGMYLGGFIVVYPICVKLGKYLPFLLAMPAGNALWGIMSATLLCLNIPYNKIGTLTLAMVIIVLTLIKYKEDYVNIDKMNTINLFMIVLAVAVMASCAMFPKNYSSDSFYHIMQYGQLIAKTGMLSSNVVGRWMTWTGLTPALISSYAVMFGFETIYAIHFLLIFSMYGFSAYCIYQVAIRFFARKMTWLLVLLTLLTVVFTPIIVAELAKWIISNTYFMVYFVFLMMFPVVAREKMDMRVAYLMALFAAWMTLSRPETAPFMCFLIISITYLDVSKKQGILWFFSVAVPEILYLFKVLYEYLIGARQAVGKMLTLRVAVIILLVLFLTGVYFLLYNSIFIKFIRKHLSVIGIISSTLGCLGLGLLDWNKFVNNVTVSVQNIITNWYWPLLTTIVACEMMKWCFRCRNRYFDLVIWGSVLFNFALCMGRTHALRLGGGDSYHRILISFVPLYIVSTIYTFLECIGSQQDK